VGKSSLTLRFCKNSFDEHQISTVDASYLEKVIQVDGHNVKLIIWDTAGQERYHALNANYYRGAEGRSSRFLFFSGALVVYDITDKDSFSRAGLWVKELKTYISAGVPIIIAGNKCDIDNRQISIEEAEE